MQRVHLAGLSASVSSMSLLVGCIQYCEYWCLNDSKVIWYFTGDPNNRYWLYPKPAHPTLGFVVRLSFSSSNLANFHARLSGDSETGTSGLADARTALNESGEFALFDLIPIDNRQ